MTDELPTLTISASDRIMTRPIEQDPESPRYEQDQWEVSQPLPGVRIINSWQIYHKMWLVLAVTDGGIYNIFLSVGGRFTLVHSHPSKIYNLFYVDDGHCLFCADDGWYFTVNTGTAWAEVDEDVLGPIPDEDVLGPIPDEDVLVPEYDDWTMIDSWWPIPDPDEIVPEYDNWMWLGALGAAAYSPAAKSLAVIGLSTGVWALVAYAEDHRIYRAIYPGGEWEEVYDTTAIWSDKWYPAIAGGPAGILAGAGSKLLRSLDAGATWAVLRDLGSVIKNIVVSNQSTTPIFAITVEPTPGSDIDKIYLSYDLGDSLTEDANRAGSISSVQSVVPTGTNDVQTSFAVLGKRTIDSPQQDYKIIEA